MTKYKNRKTKLVKKAVQFIPAKGKEKYVVLRAAYKQKYLNTVGWPYLEPVQKVWIVKKEARDKYFLRNLNGKPWGWYDKKQFREPSKLELLVHYPFLANPKYKREGNWN